MPAHGRPTEIRSSSSLTSPGATTFGRSAPMAAGLSSSASLAIEYKPKTSPSTDIAILDWSTHAVRNLTREKTEDHRWSRIIWSPDGKPLYAIRPNQADTDT